MTDHKKPLKIALHGMDSRATKTIMMYLKGPCHGVATVVDNPGEADADMFDSDMLASKQLLESHLKEKLQKPVIVLCLLDFDKEGVLKVRKPVKTDDLLRALDIAKKQVIKIAKKPLQHEPLPTPQDSDQWVSDMFDLSAEETAKEMAEVQAEAQIQAEAKTVVEAKPKQSKPKSKKQVSKKDSGTPPTEELAEAATEQVTKPVVIEEDLTEQLLKSVKIDENLFEGLEKDWFDEWFDSKKESGDES